MTIALLLNAIEEDLTKTYEDYKLINQKDRLTNLNIHQYNLPVKEEEEDEKHFPYIVIMPQIGKLEIDEETVTTTLTYGIYDENDNKQGFADILNMIERYKNHLIHKRMIGGYEVLFPITWEIQDEDSHPAYFGGIAITWKLQSMKEEEVY